MHFMTLRRVPDVTFGLQVMSHSGRKKERKKRNFTEPTFSLLWLLDFLDSKTQTDAYRSAIRKDKSVLRIKVHFNVRNR